MTTALTSRNSPHSVDATPPLGLIPSMIVFCPTVSIFVGLSYWIKDQIMGFPLIAHQHLLAGMIAGAVSNLILSMYRYAQGVVSRPSRPR